MAGFLPQAIGWTLLIVELSFQEAVAQEGAGAFRPPEDLVFRKATIVSEGTQMAAEVFAPKSSTGQKLPAIVMAHGWGGVAAQLRSDAAAFARAATWW